jgi:hypothetical protein
LNRKNFEELALKAVMDRGQMTHIKKPDHILTSEFKGQVKYDIVAQAQEEFPEIIMLEDFLNGFLTGSSFGGNSECNDAMQGIVYYGFELIKNREIYNPSKVMKATIAFQKLQEKQSLFYA